MKKVDITAAFGCSDDDAKLALQIVNGLVDDDLSQFPKTKQWVSSCYQKPNDAEIQLSCLDELLNTYGSETLFTNEWIDAYHGYARALYLNVGDAYVKTIIRDNKRERWFLGSYGDFIDIEQGKRFDGGIVEFI